MAVSFPIIEIKQSNFTTLIKQNLKVFTLIVSIFILILTIFGAKTLAFIIPIFLTIWVFYITYFAVKESKIGELIITQDEIIVKKSEIITKYPLNEINELSFILDSYRYTENPIKSHIEDLAKKKSSSGKANFIAFLNSNKSYMFQIQIENSIQKNILYQYINGLKHKYEIKVVDSQIMEE